MLLLLILAGEAVFILPFVLARVFRPTVLEVFGLNNLQLGTCFSVYGFVALIAYLFGGPLADRFPPRKLMGLSLILTAAGGIWMSTYPDYGSLKWLYGFWGFTTIFLFWAPMIKATRIWGGSQHQGKAYGLLDGGRGLVGAGFASLGVLILGSLLTVDADLLERKQAFSTVVQVCSAIVAAVGLLVWWKLRLQDDGSQETMSRKIDSGQLRAVLRLPSVWLLMIIILTAYVGYKITDIFSLFAREVMAYDEVEAAGIGTLLLYMRPVVGITIGLLADRSRPSRWLITGFALSVLGAGSFATGWLGPDSIGLFVLSTVVVATGVYGVRALYFATMQEGLIPVALTGTAVGMISLVGYTPDIFAGPMMGYLLDASPGEAGHQQVFGLLAAFGLVGLLSSVALSRINRKRSV